MPAKKNGHDSAASPNRGLAILVRVSKSEKERLKRASIGSGQGISTLLRVQGLKHADERLRADGEHDLTSNNRTTRTRR
jgi:hypothetical protein